MKNKIVGGHVPSAKIVGERRYSIISDDLGTPVEAYDEVGKRVWKRELDIYGRVRIEQGEVGLVPFLYQGQYLDTETGLAYNRFRYYSAEIGAYISQDPIRLEAGLTNLYAYVHDVNDWVDPWGPVEVLHFPDFNSARRAAFDIASGGDPNVQFTPTKVDPITGTEIEFKELMGLRLPTILLTLIWILLRGLINRILEFKLKEGVLMVEVRGLILPMMVTPTLIDPPRRVRV